MPNINWEINTYTATQHRAVPAKVNGKDLNATGVINAAGTIAGTHFVIFFVTEEDQRTWPNNAVKGNVVTGVMHANQYPIILDLLRNERPLYIRGNTDNPTNLNNVHITTGAEFTGEGE